MILGFPGRFWCDEIAPSQKTELFWNDSSLHDRLTSMAECFCYRLAGKLCFCAVGAALHSMFRTGFVRPLESMIWTRRLPQSVY